jgi:hypothetical protein
MGVEEIRLGLGVDCIYTFIYIQICNLLLKHFDIKINQFQIGKDMRVELQIPPSLNRHFKASEKNLRLVGSLKYLRYRSGN